MPSAPVQKLSTFVIVFSFVLLAEAQPQRSLVFSIDLKSFLKAQNSTKPKLKVVLFEIFSWIACVFMNVIAFNKRDVYFLQQVFAN